MHTKAQNVSGGVIAFAIVATVLTSLPVFAIISMVIEIQWYFFPLYLLIHPLVGKIICETIQMLGDGIDKTFGYGGEGKWGNWGKESKIIVASIWPIFGPVGLVIFTIVLVYGLIFLNIFG